MRLPVILSLCLALVAAPAVTHARASDPPSEERAESLARLRTAFPADALQPFGGEAAKALRYQLEGVNSGGEAAINEVTTKFAACLDGVVSPTDIVDAVIAGADRTLTNDDLRVLAEFYEGPRWKRLNVLLAEAIRSNSPDPATWKELQAFFSDPILGAFYSSMNESVLNLMENPATSVRLEVCHAERDRAIATAGLTAP